jgi:PilZ domain
MYIGRNNSGGQGCLSALGSIFIISYTKLAFASSFWEAWVLFLVVLPMSKTDLQRVVGSVVERARLRGFVLPEEIRAELAAAGLPETRWEEVVGLTGDTLRDHGDRFCYAPTVSSRQERQRQRRLNRAVRRLMRAKAHSERRRQGRIDFIHPVPVETADGRSMTLLSRDLSLNGICLIGPNSLLGQKIHVALPTGASGEHIGFSVQIVWSCVVGEGLCENGGVFLGVANGVCRRLRSLFPAAAEPFIHPIETLL